MLPVFSWLADSVDVELWKKIQPCVAAAAAVVLLVVVVTTEIHLAHACHIETPDKGPGPALPVCQLLSWVMEPALQRFLLTGRPSSLEGFSGKLWALSHCFNYRCSYHTSSMFYCECQWAATREEMSASSGVLAVVKRWTTQVGQHWTPDNLSMLTFPCIYEDKCKL